MIETIEQACEKLNAVKHRKRQDWLATNVIYSPCHSMPIYEAQDAIRLAQSYENEERLDVLTEVLGAIKGELGRKPLSDEAIKRILRWIEDEEIESETKTNVEVPEAGQANQPNR